MIALRNDDRIIPARAGFTVTDLTVIPPCQDHPRSRGVYYLILDSTVPIAGSSPLARGLRLSYWLAYDGSRIIPARAGFTNHLIGARDTTPDHPRSRGVYLSMYGFIMLAEGSSPLARGLLTAERCFIRDSGIIPARAGFTQV